MLRLILLTNIIDSFPTLGGFGSGLQVKNIIIGNNRIAFLIII
ncbi:hypothetical protein BXY75_3350 [Ulvibacter antarcticus]|uniref:Uncharacterized protein n=1 Tax=Ulvibacter antarcticus TaxID=442714 RepID=A0A3L9YAZ9_9FLAO|nr:hypothetical protein BXY75_3350 [Ulvibacter antarcticus]